MSQPAPKPRRLALRLAALLGVPVLLGLAILFFPWSWLVPMAERQASARLGRTVTLEGLAVRLGRETRVTVTGLTIANPPGFPGDAPFARIASAEFGLDLWNTLRHRSVYITALTLAGAEVRAATLADGRDNHRFVLDPPLAVEAATPSPFGALHLSDVRLHVTHAPLDADFIVTAETRPTPEGVPGLFAEARGHYAGAPLTARLAGGSVVALADATTPWPVTLEVLNGTTRATLRGNLVNGLALGGADLRLELTGPDMRFLTPLTGVPIPSTPAFRLAGRLDYSESIFRFTEMAGQVGRSDLGGTVTLDPRPAIPEVTAELVSRHVDLADLAGFIGGNPGRGVPIRNDGGRSGRVLPDAQVNLPLFRAANIRAHFHAERIVGEDAPIDTLDVTLELRDGVVTLKPLRGGVGSGAVIITGTLTPNDEGALHAVAEMRFERMEIGRVLQALGGRGGGALDGRGRIDSTGRSTAELLARGQGALSLRMAGGDLSAVAMDLAGLRLGNAIFSAMGLPSRTALECFAADFALVSGVLNTRLMLIETTEALIHGTGTIHLGREVLDLRLRSEAKQFTVGSLPTSLAVTGRLADPSVAPVIVQDRGGDGLGRVLDFALAPLSLLPIIEFGIGDDPRCRAALRRQTSPRRRR
ncbi:MAG: AsmA family protein [Roseococcus sp.]|nr:AsmA family protein [Roseococcus sp.]